MARFGDGLGLDADLVVAAEQATHQALAPLHGRVPDLVCSFASGGDPGQAAAAAERVAGLAGGGVTLGCSVEGLVGDGQGVEGRPAVSVWCAVLPGVRLRPFHLEVMRTDEGMAVVGLPSPLSDDRAGVLLADPYSFPVDGFVGRSNHSLPGLPLVGGLASGPHGPGSTRLWVDGRTVDRGAVGVLIGGDIRLRTLVSQGCRPVGPAMTVTAARGTVITELAGVPALQKVEALLAELPPAEQALASTGLHLGVVLDEYADDSEGGGFLVRGLLGVDRGSSGLVVGDAIEVGATVRLQVRDAQAAHDDLLSALAAFREQSHDAPVGGGLLFSCSRRGAELFGTSLGGAGHDVAAVRGQLDTTAVAGFFTSAELGPVAGTNHLHGFTASLLAFPP